MGRTRSDRSPHAGTRRLGRALGIPLLLLLLLPAAAAAQELGADEAEALVRQVWYEGLPSEQAARIGPEGALRLIELLEDPEAREAHANILVALSQSGQRGAYRAIARFADQPRDGELDRAAFRAWQVLPFAWGHLAEHDRRALARLRGDLDDAAPDWHFRRFEGERLRTMRRRAAASSLADCSLPEARAMLADEEARERDPALRAHLRAARERHAARAAERAR